MADQAKQATKVGPVKSSPHKGDTSKAVGYSTGPIAGSTDGSTDGWQGPADPDAGMKKSVPTTHKSARALRRPGIRNG